MNLAYVYELQAVAQLHSSDLPSSGTGCDSGIWSADQPTAFLEPFYLIERIQKQGQMLQYGWLILKFNKEPWFRVLTSRCVHLTS